ncbi:nuclear transport factor 2 family protein [Smaragdicoccus niigatensis]|uniref:nuclear transport factor 2 family protein n=1 Tax=Smaragdicoccus niigatensis TaxID=359359 RepID=UPI0003734E4D|nr:nuclear transport factor 2 family protein [Smaragdicoccus niigatensis]
MHTISSNVEFVRTMVEAFQRGDLDTVGSCFADDAVWELPGTSPVAGTYTGPEQIVGFLADSFVRSGGTLRLELIEILGSDWGAVQVQRVLAERDGRTLDCVELLAHEVRDGKIVRTYHRPDQYAIDAFFG